MALLEEGCLLGVGFEVTKSHARPGSLLKHCDLEKAPVAYYYCFLLRICVFLASRTTR